MFDAAAWIEEYQAETEGWSGAPEQLADTLARRRLAALGEDAQCSVLRATFAPVRRNEIADALMQYLRWELLSGGLPLRADDLTFLVDRLRDRTAINDLAALVLQSVTDLKTDPIPEPLAASLTKLLRVIDAHRHEWLFEPELRDQLAALLHLPARPTHPPRDAWLCRAEADLSEMPSPEQKLWIELLQHCSMAPGARPTKSWTKTTRELVDQLGACHVEARLDAWFASVNEDRPGRPAGSYEAQILDPETCDQLRGLIWMASDFPSEAMARRISDVARSVFRKVPGVGPRSAKVGNACIYVLGQRPGSVALGQLAYLKARIKHRPALKELEKALHAVAQRLNVSREELEELAVPSYGLTSVGRLDEPLGDFTAELSVVDSGRTSLAWRKPDDKLQKSIPASVKAGFPEELKDLKAAAKDIEKMLTAQRERLDNLFLQERRWSTDLWRERYLDHPLVGILARRLIWTFKNSGLETSGIWLGDTLVNVDDESIDWIDAEGTTVELWHPIGRPMDDILAWRHWLERHEVRQPFKQAHREVYVLTDAERRTATYSNRYAAHVLRQHQFNALCAARGWKNQLRLMVDASYTPPMKWLERWGLRAEFWIETIGDNYGTDTTDSGTYLYLTTDQVRFYRTEAASRTTHAWGGGYVTEGLDLPVNQPLPLELIPPIVLSEVMRDVDLFVGVASVGNDPTWADGGPAGRYREYWQNFSFGDLTPTAQTRKQVLERLVPRLKIGPRCSFSEKFLVVRGDLRTYKIHLGSGNILMEPNDQYLCIVPDSSATLKGESVFLPFEGDRTLSIILSKAMLLADDLKITDQTIIRQIKSE